MRKRRDKNHHLSAMDSMDSMQSVVPLFRRPSSVLSRPGCSSAWSSMEFRCCFNCFYVERFQLKCIIVHICGILWEGPHHQEPSHKLPRSYIAKFAPPTPFVTGRLLMMVATFKALSFLVAASPTLLVWPFLESPPFLFVGFEFHCFASYLDIPMFFEQCCLYSNQIVLYQLLFTT